jgi:hypothetical protein
MNVSRQQSAEKMSSEDDERPISEEGQEDEGPVEDEEATLAIVLHRDTERLGEVD